MVSTSLIIIKILMISPSVTLGFLVFGRMVLLKVMRPKTFYDWPSAAGPVARPGTMMKTTGVLSPENVAYPPEWAWRFYVFMVHTAPRITSPKESSRQDAKII
jgi:hypothetical protein